MNSVNMPETRPVRFALLKNERLKLYKKPSTWVLMGIVVGIILLMILLIHSTSSISNSYIQNSWQDAYNSQIEKDTTTLSGNPDQPAVQSELECLKYLLNNQILPSDWRTDAATEYYSLKYGIPYQNNATSKEQYGYMGETTPNSVLPSTGSGEVSPADEQRMEDLKACLDQNNWKSYVEKKMDDLKSGVISSASDAEKQVDIDICQLYLDNNIAPVSTSKSNFGLNVENSDMWKSTLVESIRNCKLCLLRGENEQGSLLTYTQQKEYQKTIDVALERLSKNTKPLSSDSFLGLMESSSTFLSLLTIVVAVLSGGMIANEYATGTVKLLLITPHKRRKIFWAKVTLLLEVSLISLAAVFLLSFLICGAFYGFQGIGDMQVMTLFGKVVRFPYLVYLMMYFLLMMLPVLMYGSIALMLSAVTRKGAVSVAIPLILLFSSSLIMTLIKQLSSSKVIPGIKFLLFSNTSLEYYMPSASSAGTSQLVDSTMTLGFSIAVLFVYTACFLWIAHDSFCRRDIK